jgi:argininosuccinate lyase
MLLPCPALAPPTQVWDYGRSANMRDTEGGASKRSLTEQVAKMRAYLAEQQ